MSKTSARVQRLKGLLRGEENDTPIWMTVYSDMITNLMLFFLMMFAFNLIGQTQIEKAEKAFRKVVKKEAGESRVKADVEKAAHQPLDEFLRSIADTQKDVQIINQGEGVRLRLPEPVLFDPGRAEIKEEGARVLHEMAAGLKKLPNVIVVEGHTDDRPLGRGPYKSNWELSEARAESVVDRLSKDEGVPSERLAVAGYGEYRPFAPNDSDLDRALNRRIELLVIVDEKKPS